jgi:predicted PurR-regulated permease PerM
VIADLAPWKRNTILAVIAALVLWFVWSIRSVVNPLLLGYLCAYILHPLVVKLEARGLSRRAAVNWVFLGGFLLFTGIVLGLSLQTYSIVAAIEGEELAQKIDDKIRAGVDSLGEWIGEENLPDFLVADPDAEPGDPDAEGPSLVASIVEFVSSHSASVQAAGEASLQAAGGALGFLGRVIGNLLAIGGLLFLVPLYAYYMLFELGRVHGFVKRYLPQGEREHLADVAGQIGEVIANFFRGRLLVCLIKGVLISIGLFAAGVPYPLLFGMVSGFLSIIPFFGPFLGFLVAFLVALPAEGIALSTPAEGADPSFWQQAWLGALVRTGVVFAVAELLEGYVLIPKILGDSLGLHPLVVFFALLAGGAALGMFGILIALPLTASIVILAREFVLPAMARFADETGAAT